jgi:deoxyribodipyrimidine photo-lyase
VSETKKISIFWFRRDLRLHDNAGLYHALKAENPVLPIFIFDTNILDQLDNKKDARVEFIHQQLENISEALREQGSSLVVKHGKPIEVWKELIKNYEIASVYTNRDYEPYALKRDDAVGALLKHQDIEFHTFKDHVIFEKGEVLKGDGTPYTVFTPYSRKWKAKLEDRWSTDEAGNRVSFYFKAYPNEEYFSNFFQTKPYPIPTLADIGFEATDIEYPSAEVRQGLIREYDKTRNFPAINGTSRLGIHFRFGTISIRDKARKAARLNEVFLNELIWRDFYAMILAHFPHVAKRSFRPKYDHIEWRNDKDDFQKWCEGNTGYPMVDAGMRELNQTGYMHNRVRMITASFLTKHLLIDWRWGEAYFAGKLLDFDLASNNGGWQWAAGSGTDAAPYFRIFNPASQQQKFDKEYKYVKQWVPEYGTPKYPKPMVDHKEARERCLEVYKEGLAKAETS